MFKKLSIAAIGLLPTASVANAGTLQLQPIPDAFARLGRSCGGIKQQIFGQGFDANGNVTRRTTPHTARIAGSSPHHE